MSPLFFLTLHGALRQASLLCLVSSRLILSRSRSALACQVSLLCQQVRSPDFPSGTKLEFRVNPKDRQESVCRVDASGQQHLITVVIMVIVILRVIVIVITVVIAAGVGEPEQV